ncbi:L,D-transpeptidase family protein [Streptomyces sp. TRM72054]|uniref:L,D-transpeptidase family protein n=1 Tax=Streptomyces sp. TRM72054 TaxID=2870562 RepID=UPI001C8B714A|nr:L,D-transpeptidase family protein [Streptomyces sp. TRM72054]MBX9397100.1 L,D-transpeptidase family protein [Streptomyces sp. TRM72054]
MRSAGTGRAITALAALVTVCGCTAQAVDTDGKPRGPIHVDVTDTAPAAPPPATSTAPENTTKTPENTTKAPEKPTAPAPAPPPVLWSPGDSGRDVRELQARLRQIAWLFDGPTGTYDELTEQAVRGFQGKRGLPQTGTTDTVTWQRLLKMTREPGKWDLYLMGGQPADAPDARCLTGRVLCISKSSRTLRWMIDGRTVTTLPVRFGSANTPTREGVFQVYWKSRHHHSTLYDSPMPYAMFFSGGQAVHYSSDFAARGYAGSSHGCVNVRDEAAIAQLFGEVRNGDKVVVHW